ncbi:zinc finger protein jing homolog, partial [Culicoides brevitarsis]|uniref:zinc finger protein jing homolog n=1 Tax=Culicoides brevitarsis TaxID=469753 RepID=UPI00307C2218
VDARVLGRNKFKSEFLVLIRVFLFVFFLCSGVATSLSTDSSTASSDTSDPGSPYSPPSLGETDTTPTASSSPQQAATPKKQLSLLQKPLQKMPPLTQTLPTVNNRLNQPQNQPHQWPWNNNNVAKNDDKAPKINATTNNTTQTASTNTASTQVTNKLKRQSLDKGVGEGSVNKKSRSTSIDVKALNSSLPTTTANKKLTTTPLIAKSKFVDETANTKITGYFKTQTKPTPPLKKEMSKVVMQAPVPPLTELSKPPQNENLKKYFNMLTQQSSDNKLNGIKVNDVDVRPVTTTVTNSLAVKKTIEKKTAKVSPMINTKKNAALQKQANIAPKKPVNIAPRMPKVNTIQNSPAPITAKKLPTNPQTNGTPNGKQQFLEQTIKQTPTVLLTAIRIPTTQAQQQMPPLQPTQPNPYNASPKAPQAKVGPLFSVMPNLVQIPNLVPTAKAQNIMANNQLAARYNAAAQLLMNGAVIKLQQLSQNNGTNGPTMDSTVSSTSTAPGLTPVKPLMTPMQAAVAQVQAQAQAQAQAQQQQKQLQAAQHFAAPQLFINTTPGLYYNTSGIQAMYTLSQGMQNIPALHPIQPQTANVLPNINTILPTHHQNTPQQFSAASTSVTSNTHVVTVSQQNPPNLVSTMTTSSQASQANIPKPAKASKIPKPALVSTTIQSPAQSVVTPVVSSTASNTSTSVGSQTTSTYKSNKSNNIAASPPKSPATALIATSELPKLVPVSLKVNTALPITTVPVTPPKILPPTTTIDLCSPTTPMLSPKEKTLLLSPTSPRSLVLERIKSKKPSIEINDDSTVTTVDSEVSINISVEESLAEKSGLTPNLPERSKSPILTQPKTIRFPVDRAARMRMGHKGSRRSDNYSDGVCNWDGCSEKFDNNSLLLDHLQVQHVNPQTGPYSCLWSGCKVHGRKSCSRTWLERHVLPHGGSKTYKCIVDGCGMRFGSQLLLQKHVNNHFNRGEHANNKKNAEPTSLKCIKKNGKKLRYRRQPWTARRFDYFDLGMMEGLQHRLMLAGVLSTGPRGSITFKGRPLGKRITKEGTAEVLVKWFPVNIISDEWIPAPKSLPIKHVEIKSLKLSERIELQKYLRHVYKVNQHNLQISDKDTAYSSCSYSSSASSVSGSSASSSSMMSCDSNSVSSASSSMTDNKYASCNSSSTYSRTTSSHHVIYSAVHTIKRMTKKYRKPPRTMPS